MTEPRRDWHLERSVSIGHIVTTATVVVASILYLSSLESRLEATTIEIRHQKESISRIENQQQSDQRELTRKLTEIRSEQKADTKRIEDKLDKLIERELGR